MPEGLSRALQPPRAGRCQMLLLGTGDQGVSGPASASLTTAGEAPRRRGWGMPLRETQKQRFGQKKVNSSGKERPSDISVPRLPSLCSPSVWTTGAAAPRMKSRRRPQSLTPRAGWAGVPPEGRGHWPSPVPSHSMGQRTHCWKQHVTHSLLISIHRANTLNDSFQQPQLTTEHFWFNHFGEWKVFAKHPVHFLPCQCFCC